MKYKIRKDIVQERQEDYGEPKDNFALISKLWTAYTGADISPKDVASMMILLKTAREKNKHKQDNLVDIAGYAEIIGILEGEG